MAHAASLGLVNERLWIDHCVDLNPEEIDRLALAGSRLALLPESNMKLASGLANWPAMLAAGLTVGLGTDGPASNKDLSMIGELGMIARLAKLDAMDPTALPAATVSGDGHPGLGPRLGPGSTGGAAAAGLRLGRDGT